MTNTRQADPQRGGEALAKHLGELAQDLIFDDFGTEATDARFQPIHRVASLVTLTPASVAATLGLDLDDPKQEFAWFITDLDDFYTELIETNPDRPEAVELGRVMRECLRETVAVVVGRDGPAGPGPEHPAYIVGIAPDGDLVGLVTRVVWT